MSPYTPLYEWPDIGDGQTWDKETKRYVHPRIKNSPQLQGLEPRVEAVVNMVDSKAGNVTRLIAQDLALPAAAKELELLPHSGSLVCAVFEYDISSECKAMISDKIDRFRRQHAHNLVLADKIDIEVRWKCSESLTEENVILVPEDEALSVQEAHEYRYKYPDWDSMNADGKEIGDAPKAHADEVARPAQKDKSGPLPRPERKGGFYACVLTELYEKLQNLSPVWRITVGVIVQPVQMSPEEQDEMNSYYESRRYAEESIRYLSEREEATVARRIANIESKDSAKIEAYGDSVKKGSKHWGHLNIHVDQGGASTSWGPCGPRQSGPNCCHHHRNATA
ncbi:hypothetical protein CC80DRAFT_490089 [Byssothecium circinans]|uniref:Uncharacterized protein n=1 Tax=Byssothecium circinans TaxID=147558 RepID=A0A6A5U378_9PLEO|nr:hypothetical protein CC80DRAFT_490089 [Byssothecium circinans]